MHLSAYLFIQETWKCRVWGRVLCAYSGVCAGLFRVQWSHVMMGMETATGMLLLVHCTQIKMCEEDMCVHAFGLDVWVSYVCMCLFTHPIYNPPASGAWWIHTLVYMHLVIICNTRKRRSGRELCCSLTKYTPTDQSRVIMLHHIWSGWPGLGTETSSHLPWFLDSRKGALCSTSSECEGMAAWAKGTQSISTRKSERSSASKKRRGQVWVQS